MQRGNSQGASNGGASVQVVPRSPNGSLTGALSPVAWRPRENFDMADWVKAGQRLGSMARCSQWWLGDWIGYGNTRWGEKYKEAARITNYDVKTLRNIAYVAEQVEVSRRRDNLTWSHHAEVCALDPDEQDRWLDLAAEQNMSVADLRFELRGVRREQKEVASASKTSGIVAHCPNCNHQFEISDP